MEKKVITITFEGTKCIGTVDTNKDGVPLAGFYINIPEVVNEIGAMLSKKKEQPAPQA